MGVGGEELDRLGLIVVSTAICGGVGAMSGIALTIKNVKNPNITVLHKFLSSSGELLGLTIGGAVSGLIVGGIIANVIYPQQPEQPVPE